MLQAKDSRGLIKLIKGGPEQGDGTYCLRCWPSCICAAGLDIDSVLPPGAAKLHSNRHSV